MPADYSSTARALALPISPPQSPTYQPSRISWTSNLNRTRSRRDSANIERPSVFSRATSSYRRIESTISKLPLIQQLLIGVVGVVILVLAILFFVYSHDIFDRLSPLAKQWANLPAGWLILFAMTTCTAFPPIIGYSTCVLIAGFVWGLKGWFIVAGATIVGSTGSFIASRSVLQGFVHRLVADDPRFAALSTVLEHDGLKLLIMIRLCPLPYSLSNGALSTIATVKPWTFALATACATPKLLIHVFVGSRLAAIAERGGKMDAGTKAINYASIVGGIILGAGTGFLIYRRMQQRVKQIEAEERLLGTNGSNGHAGATGAGPKRGTGRQSPASPERFRDDDELERGDVPDFLDGADEDGYRDFESDEDEDAQEVRRGGIGLERQRS
ncbi:Tlg2-vesicle protein [Agyrium rufum]|nr:Tlg2-vesicle protein [Agyrium rufum]